MGEYLIVEGLAPRASDKDVRHSSLLSLFEIEMKSDSNPAQSAGAGSWETDAHFYNMIATRVCPHRANPDESRPISIFE